MKFLGLSKSEINELISAAKSEIVIARRIAFLRTSQKLFHWWHLFPFTFRHQYVCHYGCTCNCNDSIWLQMDILNIIILFLKDDNEI